MGLSPVRCKTCDTSMKPVYFRSLFLLFLALALGWGMEFLLETIDSGRSVEIIGFTLAFILAYVAFAGPLLRLHDNEFDSQASHHR